MFKMFKTLLITQKQAFALQNVPTSPKSGRLRILLQILDKTVTTDLQKIDSGK